MYYKFSQAKITIFHTYLCGIRRRNALYGKGNGVIVHALKMICFVLFSILLENIFNRVETSSFSIFIKVSCYNFFICIHL